MSDPSAIILGMTMKWNKYTYVCNSCDGLIEMTIMETRTITTELCPACYNSMTLLSVVDATIQPSTNEKENMETESYLKTKIAELEEIISRQNSALATHQNCDYWKSENGRVQSQLIELINEAYTDDIDATSIVENLCEIIDYEPKKTVNFTGTISFSGSIDVSLLEINDFDLHYFLQDELSLESGYGDMVLDSFEVDHVEED